MEGFGNKCMNCGENFTGRKGKKYCSDYCKSNFHYEQNKLQEDSFFKRVDHQLKQNRKVLKFFNKAGKSTVRADLLLEKGFDPNFFTHYWKNGKGDVYLFCYEYGFLKRREHGKVKFVLVKWQGYMSDV